MLLIQYALDIIFPNILDLPFGEGVSTAPAKDRKNLSKFSSHHDDLASPRQVVAHIIDEHPRQGLVVVSVGNLRFIQADDIHAGETLRETTLVVHEAHLVSADMDDNPELGMHDAPSGRRVHPARHNV